MRFLNTLSLASMFGLTLALAGCNSSGGGSTSGDKQDDCTDPTKAGCVVESSKDRITSPDAPAADVTTLVTDNTKFSADLYQQIKSQEGNLFFSPFSISEAVAMTTAGARGNTLTDLQSTMRFSLDQSKLHPAFDSLDLTLASRGESAKGKDGQPFKLAVANSLWGQLGFEIETPFLDTLAQDYGAGMHVVDFQKDTDGAIDLINGWVSSNTNGKIPKLVDSSVVTPDSVLVLTNAVYFNAAWANQFDKKDTKNGDFTKRDGSTVSVPLMNEGAELNYAKGTGWQAVEMPYDSFEVSMVAILPDAGTFDDFESSLTGDKLQSILGGLQIADVQLTMPRFKLSSSFNLGQALEGMGQGLAFGAQADFTGIHKDGGIAISSVVHKAFADIDESGTEAAAATAIGIAGSAAPGDMETVRLDHPYLFVIRDNGTGAILFVGRVQDPSLAE